MYLDNSGLFETEETKVTIDINFKKIRAFFIVCFLAVYFIASYPVNYHCMKHDIFYNKATATKHRRTPVGDRVAALLVSPISLPIIAACTSIDDLVRDTLEEE
jgi:hypothetical protein